AALTSVLHLLFYPVCNANILWQEPPKSNLEVVKDSADTVNQYVVALRTQVAPLTQDFMTQFTQEAERLKARLEKDVTTVSTSLQPYAEELVAHLQRQVEELRKGETLKAVLLQKSQELKAQLDKSVNQLQAQMVPYTEEMKQKMEQSLEEFQSSMIPLSDKETSRLYKVKHFTINKCNKSVT
uniref:Apolipoprotein A-IV n=1 Tax=Lates calcarifer TaxID=8187 RepID=A0A4W6EFU8_LATCA